MNEEYIKRQGQEEAWEAARKLCLDVSDGGLSNEDILKIFSCSPYWIFNNYPASEVIEAISKFEASKKEESNEKLERIIGHCKDCKYFEYDSVAKVDGIPLIVAHEICSKWGNGCKTREDGYCFLFEPKEENEDE